MAPLFMPKFCQISCLSLAAMNSRAGVWQESARVEKEISQGIYDDQKNCSAYRSWFTFALGRNHGRGAKL